MASSMSIEPPLPFAKFFDINHDDPANASTAEGGARAKCTFDTILLALPVESNPPRYNGPGKWKINLNCRLARLRRISVCSMFREKHS
jgi:hypothetical protein